MMKTTKLIKSFFIGTLLGDSYIHNKTFYCKLISEDLIRFKADFIKKFLPNAKVSIKEYSEYTDKNNVHHQKYYVLSVSRNRYIEKLEEIFYPNGIKIYPSGIIKKMDALGFALWYADDGTTVIVLKGRSRRVLICTDNFTPDEHFEIKKDLENFGFDIKLVDRKRGGQLRTQINGKSQQKFLCTIYKYFLLYFPSLSYKMDLGYRGNSLNNETYVTKEYKKCFELVSAHPKFIDRLLILDDMILTTNSDLNFGLNVSES